MIQGRGKIYIVGAGPSDATFLTVRARELLKGAEAVVCDALVDERLRQLLPKTAEVFEVGKRGGKPSTPQSEINSLLVALCRQGKQVVRLKGGDPFIFGRCTEEIQALIEANCRFEVVPGLSSALVAPLLAGIPLTDSVLSRCFAVASAHEPDALDWEALARMDTLVFLMGGSRLSEIVEQLQRHGMSYQTPIAVIHKAGYPQQKIWAGVLWNIVEKTANQSLSPAVIVVGHVVRLREFLMANREQENMAMEVSDLPLAGKTVLVTRSLLQSSELSERLSELGAIIIEMPALEIAPPSSWQPLDDAIARLSDFDWLIFTSTNGVEYFFNRLHAKGLDARALANLKIAVVGEKTAVSLKQRSLYPDFIPPNFVADSLVAHFPESVAGKNILFPRVESGGREVLVKELSDKGANVVEVAAYESRCPDAITPEAWEALQQHSVDVITFASSKTVKNFCQLVKGVDKNAEGIVSLLQGVCIASIGPQTSKTCRELLGRVDIEAREYTMEGLVKAIAEYFRG